MCQIPSDTSLLNQYRIVRMIRSGCISETYLAQDQDSGNSVVVKVANKAGVNFTHANRHIRREATFLQRLEGHHAFPTILAEGKVGDANFLAMTFVGGPTLRDVLARRAAARTPFTPDELNRIACPLLDALDFAHRQGIWHRDLKPDNVLLSREGRPVIIDLGLGTFPQATLRSSETLVGTPGYMCPESFTRNERVDHRCDLYALGMMLYELAAGRHPFADCTDLSDMIRAQLYVPLEPLSDLRPDLPRHFADCVMRLLEKTPSARFPDARSALYMLQHAPLAPAPARGRITTRFTDVPAEFRPVGSATENAGRRRLLDRLPAYRLRSKPPKSSQAICPANGTLTACITISFLVPLRWMSLRPAPTPTGRRASSLSEKPICSASCSRSRPF